MIAVSWFFLGLVLGAFGLMFRILNNPAVRLHFRDMVDRKVASICEDRMDDLLEELSDLRHREGQARSAFIRAHTVLGLVMRGVTLTDRERQYARTAFRSRFLEDTDAREFVMAYPFLDSGAPDESLDRSEHICEVGEHAPLSSSEVESYREATDAWKAVERNVEFDDEDEDESR